MFVCLWHVPHPLSCKRLRDLRNVRTYICVCVCVCIYIYIYIYIYVCVCVCVYIYIYMCVCVCTHVCIYVCVHVYRVSHELRSLLRESVCYVKLYRYNPKHLVPKFNGYGDIGQRSLQLWQLVLTYWLPNTYWNWQEYVVSVMLIAVRNIKLTCEWHKDIKWKYKNILTHVIVILWVRSTIQYITREL